MMICTDSRLKNSLNWYFKLEATEKYRCEDRSLIECIENTCKQSLEKSIDAKSNIYTHSHKGVFQSM